MNTNTVTASGWKKAGRILGRTLLVLLETVLLVVVGLYGLLWVLAHGPSPAAQSLFVHSVRETSAVGFLANLVLSDEEIAAIEQMPELDDYTGTDPSLIVRPSPTQPEDPEQPVTDEWGLSDEDGDGIIIVPVKGPGYSGKMMVVLDPSRVILASRVEDYGITGHRVADMVQLYDGVAGINAGGFEDPNGHGNGSVPDSLVVQDGEVYYAEKGVRDGFAGFDRDHILHVGNLSVEEIEQREIQTGVSFGPALIVNGVPRPESTLYSGINPRTGIGQRSDGAILMLVIDGRQVTSAGASYQDMVEIFLSFGAVNACNLDGGSSSMMWYNGEYINHCASVIGIRPVPTAFVVLKQEAQSDG